MVKRENKLLVRKENSIKKAGIEAKLEMRVNVYVCFQKDQ